MTKDALKKILEAHKKWLNGEEGGERANLSDADLSYADLSCANLSGAKGLLDAINYMEAHFERTADGYIAYKTFGAMYAAPEDWEIKP